jgi:hypothetical protein
MTVPLVLSRQGSGARFSECGTYRYALRRQWNEVNGDVAFVGLNPSTADEEKDDPTLRRCIGFAKRWGYGGVVMLNLFAYRATQPDAMWAAQVAGADIVGPHNDAQIRLFVGAAQLVVAAWGKLAPGAIGRAVNVLELLRGQGAPPVCLGVTKAGHPRHPLYVRTDTPPVAFTGSTPAMEMTS